MEDRDVRVTNAQRESELRYLDPSRGIVGVYVGYRTKGGQMLETIGIVFSVVRKKPLAELRASEVVPQFIQGIATDVIETGEISAFARDVKTLGTVRVRPAPGGSSVGHVSITAGTLGAWVARQGDPSGRRYILSNNHVLANSNGARVGDIILQPGRYDGGSLPNDRIAVLTDFVVINFGSSKKFGRMSRAFWTFAKWVPNTIARSVGCPYRLVVQQPSPNLVDSAIARADRPEDVADTIEGLGRVVGFRDLVLGEVARKSGRTTGVTSGRIIGVNASFSVGYGSGRMAQFRDQLVVGGEFSRPGDSGSAVLTPDNSLGGLLFAGGTGVTILNRASHVVRLLGLTL